MGKPFYAGAGMVVILGTFGMMAFKKSKRSRRVLGVILVLMAMGVTIASCGGSGGSDPGSAVNQTVTLERNTQYYWRVSADGPNSHNVSAVSSFTTEP
jgi:hypothetical protein